MQQCCMQSWQQYCCAAAMACQLAVTDPCCCCAGCTCAQAEQSQALGIVTASPSAATIPAKGSCSISLSLQAQRLGRLQLPVYVRVAGSRGKPLQVVADAKAIGPSLQFAAMPVRAHDADALLPACSSVGSSVCGSTAGDAAQPAAAAGKEPGAPPKESQEPSSNLLAESSSVSHAASAVSTRSKAASRRSGAGKARGSRAAGAAPAPEWAAAAAVYFGQVQVLQQHARELRIRNPCAIEAGVQLFVESRDSVFKARCMS